MRSALLRILKSPLAQNSGAIGCLFACILLLVRMWKLPQLMASDLEILSLITLIASFMAFITASALFFLRLRRGNALQMPLGTFFLTAILIVLFSFAVDWHLSNPFFLYSRAFILVAIALVAAFQAWVWDREISPLHPLEPNQKLTATAIALLGIGLLLFTGAAIAAVRTVRFEDVYITFRYGWNLAVEGGIGWNATDPLPAEGYTSFVYVILSALFIASEIDPLVGTQIANLIAILALCFFMWKLASDIPEKESLVGKAFPVAMILAIPATAFHLATGMETLWYSVALAASASCAVRVLKDIGSPFLNMLLLSASILISGLIRPDGIVFGILTLGLLLFFKGRKVLNRRNITVILIILIIPGIIYFIWRLLYFQSLLPLSFYHKSFVGEPYGHATRSVLFPDLIGMILLPFLGVIFYKLFSKKLTTAAMLALVPATVLILYYSRVLPVAGLKYRFFYPYIFPFLIIGGIPMVQLLKSRTIHRRRAWIIGSSIILLLYLSLTPFWYESRNNVNFLLKDVTYREEEDNYLRIGKALQAIPTSYPIGIGEVGRIGYLLTDHTLIDIVGLNDPFLAKNDFSIEYLKSRQVDILLTFAYPRAPLGVYADVYRKIGENFADIEAEFSCVGNILGLDVFVRENPPSALEEFLGYLNESEDFDQGICLSNTTARWSPDVLPLSLDDWEYYDLMPLPEEDPPKLLVTGNDPIIRSPELNLNSEDFNNVIIWAELPPPIDCNILTLYFTRPDEPTESEDRSMYLPYEPSHEKQSIVANVRMHPEWHGSISKLRIDPVCGLNGDQSSIVFSILRVELH